MNGKILRPCPACKGSGKRDLDGVYAATLELVAAQGTECSGADLARLASCRNEAMCNRLVALERMGLVQSRICGRKRLWQVKL